MPLTLRASISNEINPWVNKKRTGDFYCHQYFTIWETKNKERSWNHLAVSFGIRRSDKLQWFPIWDMSNNCQKSLLFGIWKFYFQIMYKF